MVDVPTVADIQALVALCASASARDRSKHRRALVDALRAIYAPGIARQMAQRFIAEARKGSKTAGELLKD
jgi:hypothetical protein